MRRPLYSRLVLLAACLAVLPVSLPACSAAGACGMTASDCPMSMGPMSMGPMSMGRTAGAGPLLTDPPPSCCAQPETGTSAPVAAAIPPGSSEAPAVLPIAASPVAATAPAFARSVLQVPRAGGDLTPLYTLHSAFLI